MLKSRLVSKKYLFFYYIDIISGDILEILDFCPRFKFFNKVQRPAMLIRELRPIKGSPMITIRCKPTFDYNSLLPFMTKHSSHIRYHGTKFKMRLSSDIPILYISESTPFVLREKRYLVLMQEENIARPIK